MSVTAAGKPLRVGWVAPIALAAFLVVLGIVFAVQSLGTLDGMQERRTRVLGEVIHADDPAPAAP